LVCEFYAQESDQTDVAIEKHDVVEPDQTDVAIENYKYLDIQYQLENLK
jgi:hypothetical protein